MKPNHTRISYLYRDASNYKAVGEVVVAGRIVFPQLSRYLDGGEFFIPQQVGLEPLQHHLIAYSRGRANHDDHVWHELWPADFEPTDTEPSETISARELIAAFARAHRDGWAVARYSRELGLPRARSR